MVGVADDPFDCGTGRGDLGMAADVDLEAQEPNVRWPRPLETAPPKPCISCPSFQ